MLFHSCFEAVSAYRVMHAKHIARLEHGYQQLKDGLARNVHEEFPLEDSYRLYQRYTQHMYKLESLMAFSLSEWRNLPTTVRVDYPVQQLIYIGAVLHTVEFYWNWGNN